MCQESVMPTLNFDVFLREVLTPGLQSSGSPG